MDIPPRASPDLRRAHAILPQPGAAVSFILGGREADAVAQRDRDGNREAAPIVSVILMVRFSLQAEAG